MASVKDVYDMVKITGDTLATFRKEWEALSEKDRNDLKTWADAELVRKEGASG